MPAVGVLAVLYRHRQARSLMWRLVAVCDRTAVYASPNGKCESCIPCDALLPQMVAHRDEPNAYLPDAITRDDALRLGELYRFGR